MADLKMAKSLKCRAVADECACNHKYGKHAKQPNGNGGGRCRQCKGNTNCAHFETHYSAMRRHQGKPYLTPYAGQRTKVNTCIVLSRISRADFEDAVLQSILFHEKPATWKQGDKLVTNVGDEVELAWDLGLGVVMQVDSQPAQQWAKKRGCKVKAKKTATSGQKHTWEISHMNAPIPP